MLSAFKRFPVSFSGAPYTFACMAVFSFAYRFVYAL